MIKLIATGSEVEFITPKGRDYSRAIQKHQRQTEYDLSLFFLAEFCLVDGKKKEIEFYLEMYCDDYVRLIEALTPIITTIK